VHAVYDKRCRRYKLESQALVAVFDVHLWIGKWTGLRNAKAAKRSLTRPHMDYQSGGGRRGFRADGEFGLLKN
jgi:hypothetical protein